MPFVGVNRVRTLPADDADLVVFLGGPITVIQFHPLLGIFKVGQCMVWVYIILHSIGICYN